MFCLSKYPPGYLGVMIIKTMHETQWLWQANGSLWVFKFEMQNCVVTRIKTKSAASAYRFKSNCSLMAARETNQKINWYIAAWSCCSVLCPFLYWKNTTTSLKHSVLTHFSWVKLSSSCALFQVVTTYEDDICLMYMAEDHVICYTAGRLNSSPFSIMYVHVHWTFPKHFLLHKTYLL